MSAARCLSWSDAIGRFWRAMHERGAIDTAAPLDVVDLAPARGEAVRPLLQALMARAAASVDATVRLRYLACSDDDSALAWSTQTELRSLVDAGLLVALRWAPGTDMPTLGGAPWQARNPVAFIAHDLLHRLPQRLLAVQYGQVFEADPRLLEGERLEPEQAWHRREPAQDDATLEEIRRRYAGVVSSAPLGVGERLPRLVEQIHAVAPRGYLALHAAPGTASRRSLRLLGVDTALKMYHKGRTLPVDFELVSAHAQRSGAQVWSRELADGWVMHAAVGRTGDAQRLLGLCTPALEADFGDTPALAVAMRAATKQPDSAAVLALLRSAHFDVDVFRAACPALHERLLLRPVHNVCAWSQALRAVWAQVLPNALAPALHRDLALCAMRVADWSLAKQAWEGGIEAHGPSVQDLVQLGWCYLRTGDPARAAIHLRKALAMQPTHPVAVEASECLRSRLSRRDNAWRQEIDRRAKGLVLEPLDALHLDALAHQYRDPQIAMMSGMPVLPADGNLRRWFDAEFVREDRTDYAVVHVDHGFVGSVSLEMDAGCALFAFWIGADFQGQGFAVSAGRALCEFAASRGVRRIFASAYADNARSLRALAAIGFRRLPLRSTAKDNPRIFFARMPRGVSEAELVQAHFDLHQRRKLPVEFEVETLVSKELA